MNSVPHQEGKEARETAAADHAPQVTVIVPCLNEEKWIESCLESILANDYPRERLEVLVADGMSNDGTRAIVERFAASHPCVRLLDNPRKIQAAAINVGIAAARGSIILRMDAHAEYPKHYISRLVHWLEESGADIVGGVCITCPGSDTSLACAIAIGSSHPLGVGNSYFRIGVTEPRWVDAVPFGCFRRTLFDRVGLYDEELARNEDDEFAFRVIKGGGRLLLVPDVSVRYYTRESLRKLWRMYYQYGYFKPIVVRKVGGVMSVRQLVPSVFVLSLAITAVAAPWSWVACGLLAAILASYGFVIAAVAAKTMLRRGVLCGLALCAVFPVLHLSYGIGYLKGVLDTMFRGRSAAKRSEATPLTR